MLDQAHVTDAAQLQHIDQAAQRALDLVLLVPAKPGIGAGKGSVDQVDTLLQGEVAEHQAHVLPDGTGDARLEGELALAAVEQ